MSLASGLILDDIHLITLVADNRIRASQAPIPSWCIPNSLILLIVRNGGVLLRVLASDQASEGGVHSRRYWTLCGLCACASLLPVVGVGPPPQPLSYLSVR
jgi:hypothetical protein